MAASSRAGSRDDTGWGIAPIFHVADDGDEPVDGVGQGDRDHVPELHAIVEQLPGESIGGCLELGSRHAVFAACDGGTGRIGRGEIGQAGGRTRRWPSATPPIERVTDL